MDDDSEPGWEVYSKMKSRRQKVSGNHLVVDISRDINAAIDKIARATKR